MSSVDPAKLQAELFFGAKVFADHFLRLEGAAWSSSVPAGVSNQADTTTLTVQAGEGTQNLYASFTEFSSATVKYLVGRCTEFSASSFIVQVQKSSDSSWITVKTGTATGRFIVDVSAIYSGLIKGVLVAVIGDPADYGTFDYMVLCEGYKIWDYSGTYQPITDIVGETSVTKSLLNDGVNSASFMVKNFTDDSDTYTSLTSFGYGIIWASRDVDTLGTTAQKLFGGRIAEISQNFLSYGNTDVTFTLYGHASELTDSPELVYKLYAATNGRTIIEESLALCKYLVKYPHAVGWFDYTGQVSAVDDRIADDSLHSVEYDEVQPLKAITEILDVTHNPAGVIGFDMYETPSGVLVGHLRNSADWLCPVSPTLKSGIKKIDFHRIVNRQKVYGANGKEIPTNESWTESLDGWTLVSGGLNLDGVQKNEGSYALYIYNLTEPFLAYRDISNQVFGFGKRAVKTLELWTKRHIAGLGPDVAQIELWAPDSSNYFYAGLNIFGDITARFLKYNLGPGNVYDAEVNDTGIWKTVGNPSWLELTSLALHLEYAVLGVQIGIGVSVDSLRFKDSPFNNFDNISEDATSISAYGVREGEPISDQSLMSDAECIAKGDAIIAEKKDPPVTIEPFSVDGDARYNAGDILTDGVSNFRIISINHSVLSSRWEATITVSEAP